MRRAWPASRVDVLPNLPKRGYLAGSATSRLASCRPIMSARTSQPSAAVRSLFSWRGWSSASANFCWARARHSAELSMEFPDWPPPKRMQAKELRCVCPKQNSAQEKSRGRLCPATLSRDNPAQPRLAGFSLSGASPPWLEARQRLPRRPLSYMFRTWCSGSGNRELG